MKYPIIDLHSDLLSFLEKRKSQDYFNPSSRSSFKQLKEGGVALQTLAIFSPTIENSPIFGEKQIHIFSQILGKHFAPFSLENIGKRTPRVMIIPSIENASAFCSEAEPLEEGLKRLDTFFAKSPILYIGFTWRGENRFGGAFDTKVGLKEDGKRLVDFLSHKNVAIDFSHASDLLIEETLSYLDAQKLSIPLLASHSNFRKIHPEMRNLPDSLAKEIIHRKGVIGMNFYRKFVSSESMSAIISHISHGLSLGGENAISFGADFFYTKDLVPQDKEIPYFPGFSNASCYPRLMELLAKEFSKDLLRKFSFENNYSFIKRIFKR